MLFVGPVKILRAYKSVAETCKYIKAPSRYFCTTVRILFLRKYSELTGDVEQRRFDEMCRSTAEIYRDTAVIWKSPTSTSIPCCMLIFHIANIDRSLRSSMHSVYFSQTPHCTQYCVRYQNQTIQLQLPEPLLTQCKSLSTIPCPRWKR